MIFFNRLKLFVLQNRVRNTPSFDLRKCTIKADIRLYVFNVQIPRLSSTYCSTDPYALVCPCLSFPERRMINKSSPKVYTKTRRFWRNSARTSPSKDPSCSSSEKGTSICSLPVRRSSDTTQAQRISHFLMQMQLTR